MSEDPLSKVPSIVNVSREQTNYLISVPAGLAHDGHARGMFVGRPRGMTDEAYHREVMRWSELMAKFAKGE